MYVLTYTGVMAPTDDPLHDEREEARTAALDNNWHDDQPTLAEVTDDDDEDLEECEVCGEQRVCRHVPCGGPEDGRMPVCDECNRAAEIAAMPLSNPRIDPQPDYLGYRYVEEEEF